MSKEENWTICQKCQGRGKINKKLRKKVKLRFKKELAEFEKSKSEGKNVGDAPVRPIGHLDSCPSCKGSGLIHSDIQLVPDKENYPTPCHHWRWYRWSRACRSVLAPHEFLLLFMSAIADLMQDLKVMD